MPEHRWIAVVWVHRDGDVQCRDRVHLVSQVTRPDIGQPRARPESHNEGYATLTRHGIEPPGLKHLPQHLCLIIDISIRDANLECRTYNRTDMLRERSCGIEYHGGPLGTARHGRFVIDIGLQRRRFFSYLGSELLGACDVLIGYEH